MPRLNFTVDSALLRELGERLVGKPHIALAELVKNSYDADASRAVIEFAPEEDRIEVRDDGHGMTFEEFRDFWMRVGTPHKEEKRVSKYLGRSMTGAKGVGRLAVQLLAGRLKMVTVPKEDGEWLEAEVDWAEAVEAGDLVDASVQYVERTSPPPFDHGTSIVLSGLRQEWSEEEIEGLAAGVWRLQPPFRSALRLEDRFEVDFRSSRRELKKSFDRQLRAILTLWTAKFTGKAREGHVTLSLEFAGESPQTYSYTFTEFPHNGGPFDEDRNLREADFEVRIFRLSGRQRHRILVGDARQYIFKYGGVHVYDGGFRLPYYGSPENDWLRIEFVHSHRRFLSELLPEELQARYAHTERLRYLPTLGRIFGVVNVDTSREPNLAIMVTRDRLAEDSIAYRDLVVMVRYAFDLYAYEEARRQYEARLRRRPIAAGATQLERVVETLALYESQIPGDVYVHLTETFEGARKAVVADREEVSREMRLLGPLATAGMSALALQHELRKQFVTVEGIVERLEAVESGDPDLRRTVTALGEDLSAWLERARATTALFDYFADVENVETTSRFNVATVIEGIKEQTAFLARGIEVDTDGVEDGLLLPEASLVEWSALFQNVFTNAFNAVFDSERRLLRVSSRREGESREILVQDTGVGVDLESADELFQPFKRRLGMSAERRALGYGGAGLGLTIVRLLADRIGCRVCFVEPDEGFSTAFSLSWREAA